MVKSGSEEVSMRIPEEFVPTLTLLALVLAIVAIVPPFFYFLRQWGHYWGLV